MNFRRRRQSIEERKQFEQQMMSWFGRTEPVAYVEVDPFGAFRFADPMPSSERP